MISFDNKEYVSCLKKFVFFKAHGAEYLNSNPEIAKGVDERIEICEQEITLTINYDNSRLNGLTIPDSYRKDIFNGSSFGGKGNVVKP